jgi:hypothetical protein
MDCTKLPRLIVEQILERAKQQPDPAEYFSRVTARAQYLAAHPPKDLVAALVEFGHEFGLLDPSVTQEN